MFRRPVLKPLPEITKLVEFRRPEVRVETEARFLDVTGETPPMRAGHASA